MIKIGGFKIRVWLDNNLIIKRDHLGEYHPTTQDILLEKIATLQL